MVKFGNRLRKTQLQDKISSLQEEVEKAKKGNPNHDDHGRFTGRGSVSPGEFAGDSEVARHTLRSPAGRGSLKQYMKSAVVKSAVLNYVNNRGSQRQVKLALKLAGASPEEISGIDWKKSYFVAREFE